MDWCMLINSFYDLTWIANGNGVRGRIIAIYTTFLEEDVDFS